MTLTLLATQIKEWQQHHQQVVLVTGVFDLLHIEHIRFLQKAKAEGQKLIIGIEQDARVKKIKGSHRPIHTQDIRLEQIQALRSVDHAFLLPAHFDTQVAWEQLITTLKPDIYAVSSHSSYLKNKQQISQKCGVKFRIVHQFNPKYSTTQVESQIRQHFLE